MQRVRDQGESGLGPSAPPTDKAGLAPPMLGKTAETLEVEELPVSVSFDSSLSERDSPPARLAIGTTNRSLKYSIAVWSTCFRPPNVEANLPEEDARATAEPPPPTDGDDGCGGDDARTNRLPPMALPEGCWAVVPPTPLGREKTSSCDGVGSKTIAISGSSKGELDKKEGDAESDSDSL